MRRPLVEMQASLNVEHLTHDVDRHFARSYAEDRVHGSERVAQMLADSLDARPFVKRLDLLLLA